MGVHSLETFIEEKVPGGFRDVNIGQVAKEKRQSNSRSNHIVIDLKAMGFNHPLEKFDLKSFIKKDINGGDFVGYKTAWIDFLDKLDEEGIEPIFVSDGAIPGSRREVWVKRRYQDMEKNNVMLASIRRGRYPELEERPAPKVLYSRTLPVPNKYSVTKFLW